MDSKTLTGFFLPNCADSYKEYLKKLFEQFMTNKIKVVLDFGQNTSEGKFEGIDSVVRGVEVILKLFIICLMS